ncbi:SWIM zinc finger family protein [Nonomuraea jabiensis]|uniref:SWIM zinc finger family protein n=1 Tax=Nonomuraea jabiensis TaxID=882448 RepID=UPI003D705C09
MIERWSRDQVLALAPDAASRSAAQKVAAPGKWSACGTTGTVVYGECEGSGARPYLACVDLTEPAYRCSCPSRKFPCKHALGLLLMWAAEGVPVEEGAPQWVTEWVEARAERVAKETAKIEAARAKRAAEVSSGGDHAEVSSGEGHAEVSSGEGHAEVSSGGDHAEVSSGEDHAEVSSGGADGGASGGASGAGRSGGSSRPGAESVRHGRVAAGLSELERWLDDQVRQGLAGAAEHEWEGLAKRLIDAQAPGVAGVVSRLVRVRADDDWPGRLLEEYALIHLLAVAYRRRAELPGALAETVLSRVGFPVAKEEVLAGPVVRDRWDVLGRRDEVQDRLTSRRVWLRGRGSGRAALVLSFAPQGQPLDASLVTGTTIEADLTYYPGAAPLRALVAARHDRGADDAVRYGPGSDDAARYGAGPDHAVRYGSGSDDAARYGSGGGVAARSGSGADGDARFGAGADVPARFGSGAGRGAGGTPPGVSPEQALDEVAGVLGEDPWTESWPLVLAGVVPGRDSIGGLPLHRAARDPWRLIAVSGGRPVTVAVEWTPRGLRPLTTWDDEGTAVIL